jgi:hypothetical protein
MSKEALYVSHSEHKRKLNIRAKCKEKDFFKTNKAKIRNRRLKEDYGISPKDYQQMFLQQNGKCDICKISIDSLSMNLSVDHCHRTGRIRGLLCHHCNFGMGNFKDSLILLESAKQYLLKHSDPIDYDI